MAKVGRAGTEASRATAARLGLDRTLLRAGERVCVALSGGADSVALLLSLLEANGEREGLGVVVSAAHVHHGLRGAEADGDEAFVRELCDGLAVPLQVFVVDTPARQAAEREGMEEAARELRYQCLRELLAAGEANRVATAHTLDDQAETVVMKWLRGAWTEGLGGISPEVVLEGGREKGSIVRPLLRVRRAEVEDYLRARGQGWREDSSNADLRPTRNRVRHQLMPMLRSFNPAMDESLARLAEVARDEQAYWETELERLLPMMVLAGRPVRGGGRAVSTAVGERSAAVELDRLRALHPATRRRVLRAAAQGLGVRLTAEETARVLDFAGLDGRSAGRGARSGGRLQLHGGLRVERTLRELQMWRAAPSEPAS